MARRRRRRYYRDNYYDDSITILDLLIVSAVFSIIGFVTKYWKELLLLVLAAIAMILIVYGCVKIPMLVRNHQKRKLIKKGNLYNALQSLNNRYKLADFHPLYFTYTVRFKSNLQTANIDDYLLMSIDSDLERIQRYYQQYRTLLSMYKNYNDEYKLLEGLIQDEEAKTLKMSINKYRKYQTELYQSMKIKRYYEFSIVVYLNYSSPKGKVKDKTFKKYDKNQYLKIYEEYQQLKETKRLYEINARVERAKMSNSLRHDVFKRDNYRCCICGKSAKDNVRLEVGHIIPVSRGGKTEMSNLQTLYDRCNSGKSNKL